MVRGAGGKNVVLFAAAERIGKRTILIFNAVAERRYVVRVVLRIEGRAIVEERVSAANARLAILERIPSEAEARRPVVVVRVGHGSAKGVAVAPVTGRPLIAVVEQAGQGVFKDCRPDAGFVSGEIECLIPVEG